MSKPGAAATLILDPQRNEVPTMIVWRVDYQDPDRGNCVEWCQTLARATAHAKDLDGEVEQTHIPQMKGALVAWLNTHFNTDNG